MVSLWCDFCFASSLWIWVAFLFKSTIFRTANWKLLCVLMLPRRRPSDKTSRAVPTDPEINIYVHFIEHTIFYIEHIQTYRGFPTLSEIIIIIIINNSVCPSFLFHRSGVSAPCKNSLLEAETSLFRKGLQPRRQVRQKRPLFPFSANYATNWDSQLTI